MPKKTQTINTGNVSVANSTALSYGVFEKLGWVPKYAGDSGLVGYTKISFGQPKETITVQVGEGFIEVTSELPESASFDLLKKNEKNLNKFSFAFEEIKTSSYGDEIMRWGNEVENLKQTTVVEAEEQKRISEEVDNAMNLSTGSKTITYGLIAINILVFVLMAISGVNPFEPTNLDIANWGGNYKPFTIDAGEWWRLLTSTFVHIGVVHLLFNMYALFMVGIYLEPMLGKLKYIIAYIITGLLASLTSISWHGESVISAGASGAIFGIYGVFLALLTTNLIPKAIRKSLLQSIGIFVVFNLAYGLKAGIDNAAHVGGLISGFVIGYLYYPFLKNSILAKTTAIQSNQQ